jgi:hypothetical protein
MLKVQQSQFADLMQIWLTMTSARVWNFTAFSRPRWPSVIHKATYEVRSRFWFPRFGRGGLRDSLMVGSVSAAFLNATKRSAFDEPPSAEVVLWWDQRAQTARAEINERLLLQGREAERLSFAYERDRLKALGVAREPRWIAIEDNTAGFDILSYDQGPVEPVSRLIEVKSSTQNPPRITLTRNEWEAATRFDQSYIFHIWTLPARTLIERSVADMVQHIPKDEGSGVWIAVEITVRR